MNNRYSIYIISTYDYNMTVIVNILRGPNYDGIHTEFSNYLDL